MAHAGPPQIFSRRAAAAKWARARSRLANGGGTDFLSAALAEDVAERLGFIRLQPSRALVVGDHTMRLPAWLDAQGAEVAVGLLGPFEEERPAAAGGFDLIVHLLGLGHVNDLPGALVHARQALAEGGLFVAAFPGAGSLASLRRIALATDGDRPTARMHPLVDNRAAAALLVRAGFRRQVVDTYPINLRYSDLATMVNDLRDHGLTRALSQPSPPWTRAMLARARAAFEDMRDEGGKVPETIEVLVMSGWR